MKVNSSNIATKLNDLGFVLYSMLKVTLMFIGIFIVYCFPKAVFDRYYLWACEEAEDIFERYEEIEKGLKKRVNE